MRAAICEDEKIYSDFLHKHVREYFQNSGNDIEISVFSDGVPLLEAYAEGETYDIVFLDIQLEASDGMEVARKIREYDKKAALIFVTGLEDRSIEGYEVAALDYVVKTALEERLFPVLDRFMENRRTEMFPVPLPEGDTAVVRYSDILWIESEGRGTRVCTKTEKIYSPMAVGKIAGALPGDRFIEAHKSVYVQIREIRRIGTDTVEMSGGETLPLSRRRRKPVMSAVMDAVKGG